MIEPDEVPVFWACGVTPQLALEQARLELAITHSPGCMFVTDLADSAFLADSPFLCDREIGREPMTLNTDSQTSFPVSRLRAQFPALSRRDRRPGAGLLRRAGRQPGAAERRRCGEFVPHDDQRQPRRRVCDQSRQRRPARRSPRGAGRFRRQRRSRLDRLRRQHDHAHAELEPGVGPHLAAGRRGDGDAARPRRQCVRPGCWRRAMREPACCTSTSVGRIARSIWPISQPSSRRGRGW